MHRRRFAACARCSAEEVGLDLGVEDEDESSTSASDDVGEGTLEEGLCTFVGKDSLEAVNGAVVHFLSSSGVHHKSTSDRVERVGDDTSGNGNTLSEGPHGEHVSLLGVWEEHGFACVEHSEVRGTVGDDTNDGDSETSVETIGAILFKDLLDAVDETVEFTLATLADVSSKTGSSEIKRVNDSQGSGTSGSTGGAVTNEEHAWLLLWVIRVEDLLVKVLEGEVQSLGGEISDDVGEVTSPERSETLFLDDSLEAVANTVISVLSLDCRGSILDLEEELDSLNGSDNCLGDSSGDTADHEIGKEALFLGRRCRHDYFVFRIFNRLIFQL